jgi:hypothetical protein
MIIESLISLRNCIDLLGAILYQPIIFGFSVFILYKPINSLGNIYEQTGTVPFPYIILLITGMIIIVLIANALIELSYYLFHAEERYKIIFAIQKGFYNYSLIIVSLIAFWVSYDHSLEASVNLELLFIGGFFFLCVIFTDLYSFFIHSKGKVKDLYDDIISKKRELF